MGDKPEIVREARLENLASLIKFVEKACRQTNAEQQVCLDIRLAVEEVCTNLIRHGYAGMEPGPIRLNFQTDGEKVIIRIGDHAPPFHPQQAPPLKLDSEWQKRPVGGFGWHLIPQVMDQITYESDPIEGNVLTLIKRICSEKDVSQQEQ